VDKPEGMPDAVWNHIRRSAEEFLLRRPMGEVKATGVQLMGVSNTEAWYRLDLMRKVVRKSELPGLFGSEDVVEFEPDWFFVQIPAECAFDVGVQ
jgi:hypothetical protein